MSTNRFYAALNPAWKAGERYESRYAIIDRVSGRPVPKAVARTFASRMAADKAAQKLNDLEAACAS